MVSETHVDTMMLWKGIELARYIGFRQFIIESDCQFFMKEITDESVSLSPIRHIIECLHQNINKQYLDSI